jgi:hypothetical protein
MTADVQAYVFAADRDNTVRSYAAALRNFETVWKGMLPATVDTVARYLAEHASIYRLSTLRLHLAALARWHADNGFADRVRRGEEQVSDHDEDRRHWNRASHFAQR